MRHRRPSLLISSFVLVYRLFLRACPPPFRRQFGREMCRDFAALCEESWRRAGRLGLLRMGADGLLDLLETVLRERRPPALRIRRRNRSWGDAMMSGFLELRQASRSLAKTPSFTLVVVMTLAVGIGATTALFSVVEAVLLRPLPYKDPEKIVSVWEMVPDDQREERARFRVAAANYFDWREQSEAFEEMALFALWSTPP